MVTQHLGQLHLGPELHEVQNQEAAHDEAEDEHVLWCPLDILGLGGHSIAVVTASLAVLQCQNEGIDDVNRKATSEHERAQHSIPVGAKELADGIISLEGNEGHRVHQRMECDE